VTVGSRHKSIPGGRRSFVHRLFEAHDVIAEHLLPVLKLPWSCGPGSDSMVTGVRRETFAYLGMRIPPRPTIL
jgi:hypothetical protein